MHQLKKINIGIERLLRKLNARLMLACLLLMEALIFLIDIDTGNSISYAPFLSAPTALSAWFLSRRTTLFFVVISSIARAIDFGTMHARQDSAAMLLYDVLQSAAFYGIVALLVLKARSVFDHLALHAHNFKRAARQERHRRMMESSIRRALPADVETIIRLTDIGGESGGFDRALTDRVRHAALTATFTQGIVEGAALRDVWTGGQSTVPIEFWVSVINGKPAGFMMILGLDGQKGPEREMHAIVVDPAYQGMGVGAALVDFFCAHYTQRRMFSACRPDSTMMKMLLRRGFKEHSALTSGYQILMRE